MTKKKLVVNPITPSFLILFITILMTGLEAVDADPDAMARPTRPKVFSSVDELRKYLDLVRDYYSLSGKARYGKRAEMIQTEIDDPTYVQRANFFTETINDEAIKETKNDIIKQLSNPVIPEWLKRFKMIIFNRQGNMHGTHWI